MSRVTVSVLSKRVDDLEKKVDNMETKLTQQGAMLSSVHSDTHKIVAILEGAKGWAAIAKRHGPRAIAFVLGILVSQGFLDAETAAHIRGFFPH